MISKLGGRKFVFILIALSVATAIELGTERGITQNYMYLIMGLAGVFTAGNAVVDVKELAAGKLKGKALDFVQDGQVAPAADPGHLAQLEAQLAELRKSVEADQELVNKSFGQVVDRFDNQQKAINTLTSVLTNNNA